MRLGIALLALLLTGCTALRDAYDPAIKVCRGTIQQPDIPVFGVFADSGTGISGLTRQLGTETKSVHLQDYQLREPKYLRKRWTGKVVLFRPAPDELIVCNPGQGFCTSDVHWLRKSSSNVWKVERYEMSICITP